MTFLTTGGDRFTTTMSGMADRIEAQHGVFCLRWVEALSRRNQRWITTPKGLAFRGTLIRGSCPEGVLGGIGDDTSRGWILGFFAIARC
jgi:hypothetical protein